MLQLSSTTIAVIALFTVAGRILDVQAQDTISKGLQPTFEIGTDVSRRINNYYTSNGKEKRIDTDPTLGVYGRVHIPKDNHQFDITGQGFLSRGMSRDLNNKKRIATSDIHRYAYDIKAEYGYQFPLFALTPSVGLGYTEYTDHAQKNNTDLLGISNHTLYGIVGVAMRIRPSDHWYVQPKISYNHIIRGTQSTINATGQKSTYSQNQGHSLEVSAQFVHEVSLQQAFFVTPYYRIAETGGVISAEEHKKEHVANRTKNQSVGIRMGYAF